MRFNLDFLEKLKQTIANAASANSKSIKIYFSDEPDEVTTKALVEKLGFLSEKNAKFIVPDPRFRAAEHYSDSEYMIAFYVDCPEGKIYRNGSLVFDNSTSSSVFPVAVLPSPSGSSPVHNLQLDRVKRMMATLSKEPVTKPASPESPFLKHLTEERRSAGGTHPAPSNEASL